MTKPLGRLYGVSLGPGDPELITRQAWAQLQRPDPLWAYPLRNLKKPDSYALDIVRRSGLAIPADAQPLLFPMTYDAEKLARHWLSAAHTVLESLRTGRDVLFLVEGDTSTYATFGHLATTVASLEPDLEILRLPGVNAFTAAAARTQQALCEQDDTLAVIPAAYGLTALDGLLDEFDTLILLKVKPLLDDLITWLDARGLLEQTCFIERCGAPDERVIHDLHSLRGASVSYLSLLLVKNPHRVRGERVRGCRKKTSPLPETLS